MTLVIHITVNGEAFAVTTAAHLTLLDLLRDNLGLLGTREGCRVGECGACTVLLDGRPVNACLVLAPDVEGRQVTTVEGLAQAGALNPLQTAFVRHGALQCGYCTSGMLMTATALLAEARKTPLTETEVRTGLAGNLCRCTGYVKIVEAILEVAHDT